MISGNSYILESGADNVPPVELYRRPDRIRIKGPRRAIPDADYVISGQTLRVMVDPGTGKSKIKHIKLFNQWMITMAITYIIAATDIDQHVANKHIKFITKCEQVVISKPKPNRCANTII